MTSTARRIFMTTLLAIALFGATAVAAEPSQPSGDDSPGDDSAQPAAPAPDSAASAETPGEPAAKDQNPTSNRILVDYKGSLQDENGDPVSGIFHFEFKLYDDSNAAESLWSETHYVSVVDGSYVTPLGKHTELERSTITGDRWIGVEMVGEGEILRDRFAMGDRPTLSAAANTNSGGDSSATSVENDDEAQKMLEKARNNDQMAFADVAEQAVTADRAKVAESANKLGSMTADEVEHLSNLALEKLGKHIADPSAHDATGGRLGDQRRVMNRVGGGGGSTYNSSCPQGYVVTGIRGTAGRVLDSISIVCRKLQ